MLQAGSSNIQVKLFYMVNHLVEGPTYILKCLLEVLNKLMPQLNHPIIMSLVVLSSGFLLLLKSFQSLVGTKLHLCNNSGHFHSMLPICI